MLHNLIGGFILAGIPIGKYIGDPVMPYWGITVCGLILTAMIINLIPEPKEEPVRIEPVFN